MTYETADMREARRKREMSEQGTTSGGANTWEPPRSQYDHVFHEHGAWRGWCRVRVTWWKERGQWIGEWHHA